MGEIFQPKITPHLNFGRKTKLGNFPQNTRATSLDKLQLTRNKTESWTNQA